MTAARETTEDRPLPAWARSAVYVFGATVGGCALAASGFDLYALAVALGFVFGTALAVPIGLDAGAVVCGVRWITAPAGSPERARWRNATLGLVGASAVLNGLSVLAAPHWLANGIRAVANVSLLPGRAAVAIAVLVAVAFPLVAAWMVHAILEVRDNAARNRQPRAPIFRAAGAAVAEWVRRRAEDRRTRRRLSVLERELAVEERRLRLARAEPEERPEPQDTAPEPAADRPEDATGETAEPEPEPPALTGHKMSDARAWFLHELRLGRSRTPTEVNTRIGSDCYVGRRHIREWTEEYEAEAPEDTGPVLRAVGE